jgi:hypothetical protein
MTGSNVAFTFYSTGSDGITTSSVYMTGGVSIGTEYLAEFFFDASSADKRVGMALYGTSSLITSSYFSSSSFLADRYGLPSGTQQESLFTAQNTYRTINHIKTTTGQTDFYRGTIAFIFLSTINFENKFPHFNENRRSIYNWARLAFFPSSSFVTHSLFANS